MMRIFILLCLIIPAQAFSETSLWRVSKNDSELFIGGTVHVLGKQDYPLPQEFEQAYKKAQTLVLETDLNAANKQEMQTQFLQKLTYPKGETLKNHIKPATYKTLELYLKKQNIPVSTFHQFKPTLIMLTLTIVELKRLGFTETGVDAFFSQKALADKKTIGQLETPEAQLNALIRMGEGHEDEMILSTLDDLNELPAMMHDLKTAWRNGDLAQMEKLELEPMRKQYPAIYQIILVQRNLNWLPQIEGLLKSPETELILVGALHLVGKDGLLEQLRQRGYKVEAF